MNPNALQSKRDEGRDQVAKRNQMLNIYSKALGWDLIVRTPKFTYLPHEEPRLFQGPHHTRCDSAQPHRVWS